MSIPRRSELRSPWEPTSHKLGTRYVGEFNPAYYDKNVRYVLEDIAVQLARIADALEDKRELENNNG